MSGLMPALVGLLLPKPIQFYSIGPAFWGLLGGLVVSLLVDRGDFTAQRRLQQQKDTVKEAHA